MEPQIQPPDNFQHQTPAPTAMSVRSKVIIAVSVLIMLSGISYISWLVLNYQTSTPSTPPAKTQQAATSNSKESDMKGIQVAVNQYCTDLGKAFGFKDMYTGYIISERFSEAELSDSPELLRFKQVGTAAVATVDCEDANGANGISNDLLFVKEDTSWAAVDEEQNNAGSGFLCSVVDEYRVSKELISKCAPSEGAATQQR